MENTLIDYSKMVKETGTEVYRNLKLNNMGKFQEKNYQLYAQYVFTVMSNSLRWFILDYVMGSGKTATALNIVSGTGGNVIVVGNDATQVSFQNDAKKMNISLSNISFITVNKVSMLEKDELLRLFQNSYIIIDEFQHLYSQQGLNSYGEAFKFLFQHQLKKLKVICLSGTMFNSSVEEIQYLLSIFGESYETMDQAIDILSKHTISWTKQNTDSVPQKIQIQEGPELIKNFGLIRCQMSEEHYQAYLQSESQEDQGLSTTKYILPKYYYDKNNKYEANKILKGDLVQMDNLKKHSPMSYYFISSLLKKLKQKDCKKSAAYIRNIESQFGLNQYVQILEENGFIAYGKTPVATTVCFNCGQIYKEHKDKKEFTPAVYAVYGAQITKNKRDLQTNVFNSYENKTGSQICLIMLTSIAETGLSLSCVNNFYILDNVPEISKFNQIVARAIRFKSHMFLPPEKRFVNVYCLTVSAPGYKTITKHEQKWVDIFKEDMKIQKLYDTLRKNDFNLLVENPEKTSAKIHFSLFFSQYQMQQVLEFVKNLEIIAIKYKELKNIIINNSLAQLEYTQYRQHVIDFSIITYYNIKEVNGEHICTRRIGFIERANTYQPIKVSYQTYDSIHPVVNSVKKTDLFYNLNQTHNFNAIRSYIKDFMQQGVLFCEEFKKNDNFTAFMIFENLVYCENDEHNYVENHKKLFSDIYNKDLNYVKDHIKSIISKHHIKGFFQGGGVYDSKGLLFKTSNRPIEEKNLVQFYITKHLPQFKLIKNGFGYDCITLQPGFQDIFEDEYTIRQNDYERQNFATRCRYILYYALAKNRLNIPDFIK